MSWTDERIERLKSLWTKGMTASHIADELGGVSRNAVIGKAHRLGLQSRPSPVKPNEPEPKAKAKAKEKAEAAPAEAKRPAAEAPQRPAAPKPERKIEPTPAAPVLDAYDEDEDEDPAESDAVESAPAKPKATDGFDTERLNALLRGDPITPPRR